MSAYVYQFWQASSLFVQLLIIEASYMSNTYLEETDKYSGDKNTGKVSSDRQSPAEAV